MNKLTRLVLVGLVCLGPVGAMANWSANLGYRNPHTSTFGVNFIKFWGLFALEVGLGHIEVADEDDNESGISLGGGFNGKYLFYSGLFRPYVQMGFGMSAGVSGDGAGFGSEGLFHGAGVLINDASFYFYASYNISGATNQGFPQAGLGFHF